MKWWLTFLGAAFGCGGEGDGGDGPLPAAESLFVVASDFTSSLYGWAPLEDPTSFSELGPAEGDTVAVRTAGRIVVIERTSGALTLLDEDLAVERNFSVADEGSEVAPNPQDVLVVREGVAYVARFSLGSLAIVDLAEGRVTGTIDLSGEDEDGVPDMTALAPVGDRVLVALELLDETFAPSGAGRLVVIDATTDEVVDRVELPARNPVNRFRVHGETGELVIACAGVYADPEDGADVLDGAIVALGPEGDAPRILVDEVALGGNVGGFAIAEGNRGWAIVARTGLTALVPFDAETGEVSDAIVESEGYDLRDLELAGDRLYVADANLTTPGLRVFDLEGVEQTDEPIDVGLPPSTVLAF